MKDVAVIIPVYNAESYLERCINSVRGENSLDMEIILIDDGSTDNSYSICRNYADIDSRIRLIQKTNEGQGIARNIGIAMSNSKYLYFLDSDDYISEHFLSELFSASETHNLDICMPKTMDPQYKKALEYITCVQSGRQFVRSALIKDNGIWQPPSRSGQDGVFIHLAFALCAKLGVVPSAQYFYVARDDGTFKRFSKMHERSIGLIKEHYSHLFYYYDTKSLWKNNAVRLAHFFEDETLKFRILPHFKHLTDAQKEDLCSFVREVLNRISAHLSKNELETLSTLTNELVRTKSVEECIKALHETAFTKKQLPVNVRSVDNILLCEFFDTKYSPSSSTSSTASGNNFLSSLFKR